MFEMLKSHRFSQNVIRAGDALYAARAVTIVAYRPSLLSANVRDRGQVHLTNLRLIPRWQGLAIEARCSCDHPRNQASDGSTPGFDGGVAADFQACPHVWAAVRAGEDLGYQDRTFEPFRLDDRKSYTLPVRLEQTTRSRRPRSTSAWPW